MVFFVTSNRWKRFTYMLVKNINRWEIFTTRRPIVTFLIWLVPKSCIFIYLFIFSKFHINETKSHKCVWLLNFSRKIVYGERRNNPKELNVYYGKFETFHNTFATFVKIIKKTQQLFFFFFWTVIRLNLYFPVKCIKTKIIKISLHNYFSVTNIYLICRRRFHLCKLKVNTYTLFDTIFY